MYFLSFLLTHAVKKVSTSASQSFIVEVLLSIMDGLCIKFSLSHVMPEDPDTSSEP